MMYDVHSSQRDNSCKQKKNERSDSKVIVLGVIWCNNLKWLFIIHL